MTEEELMEIRGRAWRLFSEGNAHYEKCEYDAARDAHANALILMSGLAEKTGSVDDLSMLLSIRNGYGNAAMAYGDYASAKKAYTGALELYAALPEKSERDLLTADSAATTLSHMSRQTDRDLPSAIRYMNVSALIEKAVIEKRNLTGDWRRFRRTLTELFRMKRQNNDSDTLSACELALTAARRTLSGTGEDRDMREVARLLNEKGSAETDRNLFDTAEDTFSEAFDAISGIYRRSSSEEDQRIYSSILMNRALLSEKEGNLRRAADYYGLTVSPMEDLAERTGTNEDRSSLRYLHLMLGIVLDRLEEPQEAYDHYREASVMSEELGTYDMRPELLGKLQEILLDEAKRLYLSGDSATALSSLMNAYRSERDTANHSGLEKDWVRLYETLTLMGRINIEDKDYEAALECLSEAWYVLERLERENPSKKWKEEEVKLALSLSHAWSKEEFYEDNPDWPTEGTDWYEKALSAATALSSSDDKEERRMLPWLLLEKARICRAEGETDEAIGNAEKSADMLSSLTETDPVIEDLRLLATATGFLGELTAEESPAFRETLYRKSSGIYSEIADLTGRREDRKEATKWMLLLSRELEADEALEVLKTALDKVLTAEVETPVLSDDLTLSVLTELTQVAYENDRLKDIEPCFTMTEERLGDTCWSTAGNAIAEYRKELALSLSDEAYAKEAVKAYEGCFRIDRARSAEGLSDLARGMRDRNIPGYLDAMERALALAERSNGFSSTPETRKLLLEDLIMLAESSEGDKAQRTAERALPQARETHALYDTPETSEGLLTILEILTSADRSDKEELLNEALRTAERERDRKTDNDGRKVKDIDAWREVPPVKDIDVLKNDQVLLLFQERMEDFLEAGGRERETLDMRVRSASLSSEITKLIDDLPARKAHIARIEKLNLHLSEMKEWKYLPSYLLDAEETALRVSEEEKTTENIEALIMITLDLAEAYLHMRSPEASKWNAKAMASIKERQRMAKETPLSVWLRAECTAQKGECEWQESEDPAMPIERLREAWNAEFEETVRGQEHFSISHMLSMLERTEKYYGLLGRESDGEDYVISRFRDLSEKLGHGPWETLPEARSFRERLDRETREEITMTMPTDSSSFSPESSESSSSMKSDLSSLNLDALLSGTLGSGFSSTLGDLSALMVSDSVEAGKGTEEKAPAVSVEKPAESDAEDEPKHREAMALFEHATRGWLNNRKELRKALSIWKELEEKHPSGVYEEWISKTEKLV